MVRICTVYDFGMTDYTKLMPKIVKARDFGGIEVKATLIESKEHIGTVVENLKITGDKERIEAFIEYVKSL